LIVLTQNPSLTSYPKFITVEIIRTGLLNIPSLCKSQFTEMNSERCTCECHSDCILSTSWSHAVLKQWHYCFPSVVFIANVPTTYILLPGVLVDD